MFDKKPWLRGVIENIYAADLIRGTSLENRNRIGLILLDTALEVAFKYYLTYEIPQPVKIDKTTTRDTLHKMVEKKTSFEEDIWKKIRFFYDLRCDLYHETAGKTLMDSNLNDFYKLVLYVVTTLFDIPKEIFEVKPSSFILCSKSEILIPINKLKTLEQIIVVVKRKNPSNSSEIALNLKQMGAKKVPPATTITAYMKNPAYSHYFHYSGGKIFLTETEGEEYFRKIEEIYKKLRL